MAVTGPEMAGKEFRLLSISTGREQRVVTCSDVHISERSLSDRWRMGRDSKEAGPGGCSLSMLDGQTEYLISPLLS